MEFQYAFSLTYYQNMLEMYVVDLLVCSDIIDEFLITKQKQTKNAMDRKSWRYQTRLFIS